MQFVEEHLPFALYFHAEEPTSPKKEISAKEPYHICNTGVNTLCEMKGMLYLSKRALPYL